MILSNLVFVLNLEIKFSSKIQDFSTEICLWYSKQLVPHIGYSEEREGKKIELALDYPKLFCINILKKKQQRKNSGHIANWGKRWTGIQMNK